MENVSIGDLVCAIVKYRMGIELLAMKNLRFHLSEYFNRP